jgi:ribosomal protein S12 methylthiotransferase accessory factor YcaO
MKISFKRVHPKRMRAFIAAETESLEQFTENQSGHTAATNQFSTRRRNQERAQLPSVLLKPLKSTQTKLRIKWEDLSF